jgi:hypothetical protein
VDAWTSVRSTFVGDGSHPWGANAIPASPAPAGSRARSPDHVWTVGEIVEIVNAIMDGPSRNLSPTTIASGTSRTGQRADRERACRRTCRSSTSTPTSRWVAQLLRPRSVNDVASGSPEARDTTGVDRDAARAEDDLVQTIERDPKTACGVDLSDRRHGAAARAALQDGPQFGMHMQPKLRPEGRDGSLARAEGGQAAVGECGVAFRAVMVLRGARPTAPLSSCSLPLAPV